MQNSSAFQFIAIDQIRESATNPRQTFEEAKLHELAESIRQHGLIQPITVRPQADGFEIVAGARRFRAAQLAELFSLPARIVELTDGQSLEWALVENSQRVDVHPYEEAQGFQRLLDLPGYDVAALVEKSGKSASHIYARLSLLQLLPSIAKVFAEELITSSHANLLARLPQEHQMDAYAMCWRKDWQDTEPHLLPARHLSAWIQANLFLSLADAPFDHEDFTLNPVAGACTTCPRRTGYNTSLFADVQAEGEQCLDAPCFRAKVGARIDRELAARPELVRIENGWRHAREQRPGAVQRGHFREIEPAAENPDAEPTQACAAARTAIIVYGKRTGTTLTVCTDNHCPIHDPRAATRQVAEPEPIMSPAPEEETDEEAEQRRAEQEQRRKDYEAEQFAAQTLAARYGADPSAADWRRFGRLPGFTNCKAKYKRPDGLFPFVRLQSYFGQQFSKAQAFLEEITIASEDRERQREQRRAERVLSPQKGPRSVPSLERFRTSAKYANRPAAADIAFCVAALSSGMEVARTEQALTDEYLSSDPSQSKRAAYIRRTIGKARDWVR